MLHEAVLLCQNLLEPGEAGEGILLRQLRLALNEWQGIVDEVVRHAVAFGVDPLLRDLLLLVCNRGEGEQHHRAMVLAVDIIALERDHLTGHSGNSLNNSFTACVICFVDIGRGGKMRAAALQKAQLNAAHLGAGVLLDNFREHGGKPAELDMAESVGRGGLRLGNEGAVGIMDALGHSDEYLAVLLIQCVDVR